MKYIIFDFEVFKNDTLLGAFICDENLDVQMVKQLWNIEKIKALYENYKNDIWVGFNNEYYDNLILQSIIQNKNVKETNDLLINKNTKLSLNINLNYYDLMKFHQSSLKQMECFFGDKIDETEVDFNLDRNLTEEEKKKTESYNLSDLVTTYKLFLEQFDEIKLRLDLIKDYNLSLKDLCLTECKLAEKVFKISKTNNITTLPVYDNLKIENKDILNFFYQNKGNSSYNFYINDTLHIISQGGIHGAKEKITRDKDLYYIDVSGFYNLIMINYNLLPSSMSEESKKLYIKLYNEQLKLKGVNDFKRKEIKVLLLAIAGAMNNEYSLFYEPSRGNIIRLTGEMFLIDLLEKLEAFTEILQSNTDGIILTTKDENKFNQVINEWMERTHFNLSIKRLNKIVQKDVNNYCYIDDENKIHCKGELLKYYSDEPNENTYLKSSYMSKYPLIICRAVVDNLLFGTSIENTITKYKDNYKLFQFIVKKNSYDYLGLEEQQGFYVKTKRLQNVNRVFASNNLNICKIFKIKTRYNKISKCQYANLPEHFTIFNDEINDKSSIDINYNFYVNFAYKKLSEYK